MRKSGLGGAERFSVIWLALLPWGSRQVGHGVGRHGCSWLAAQRLANRGLLASMAAAGWLHSGWLAAQLWQAVAAVGSQLQSLPCINPGTL